MPLAIELTGADPDGDPLIYLVVTQPSHGSVSGEAPFLTYTARQNYKGNDSFTFKVNDGTLDSAAATVTITVNAVNDAPTITDISDQTVNEDTPTSALTFTVGDIETAHTSGPRHATELAEAAAAAAPG